MFSCMSELVKFNLPANTFRSLANFTEMHIFFSKKTTAKHELKLHIQVQLD